MAGGPGWGGGGGRRGREGALPGGARLTHGGDEAVVTALLRVEDPVFDEDGDGSQHERRKQVHVDEVPGAMQLPTPRAGGGKGFETVNPPHSDPHVEGALGRRQGFVSVGSPAQITPSSRLSPFQALVASPHDTSRPDSSLL